jgi:hypothetical protein
MFPYLSPTLFNISPIKLTYLNGNRDFYGDFTLSGSHEHFKFQDELSAVEDIAIAFDSVNFLTDVRNKMSNARTNSTLAVFNEEIDIDCNNVIGTYGNYWITIPLDSYTNISGVCISKSNVLALKNNFSDTHHPTCTPCYRISIKPRQNLISQYQIFQNPYLVIVYQTSTVLVP